MMRNYIFVGLGPHAKRIYYPFLEKYQLSCGIRIRLLIELDIQEDGVSGYLSGRALQPDRILYLKDNDANRRGLRIDPLAKTEMDALLAKEKIDGIIISTEPKAHKIYAEWAIANGVNILMDKPITAPIYASTDIKSAEQIYGDYAELEIMLKRSASKFYVVCQRRNHPGYSYIKDYLNRFVSKFEVPISYIDIYHADGAWSLPHEFMKENHPYKYGYGKLMHSGYHFIDLFAWLAKTNQLLARARPDSAKVFTARFTPNDLFNQLDENALNKIYDDPRIGRFFRDYKRADYERFGELDAYILFQLMKEGNVVTSGSINLQQNSFSRRAWSDLPEDTYKGNGRVRHERVNIQVSHLLNIQVHSYQSYEAGKDTAPSGVVGSEDHFDIYIFRNKKLVGGEALTKISVGGEMKEKNYDDPYYLGHNEKAREQTLLNFIYGRDDESELAGHKFTNQLLSQIYRSIAMGAQNGNPHLMFNI